jgi:hypothetical protein
MATGHDGGGGPSRESNHPALTSVSALSNEGRRFLTTFFT